MANHIFWSEMGKGFEDWVSHSHPRQRTNQLKKSGNMHLFTPLPLQSTHESHSSCSNTEANSCLGKQAGQGMAYKLLSGNTLIICMLVQLTHPFWKTTVCSYFVNRPVSASLPDKHKWRCVSLNGQFHLWLSASPKHIYCKKQVFLPPPSLTKQRQNVGRSLPLRLSGEHKHLAPSSFCKSWDYVQ